MHSCAYMQPKRVWSTYQMYTKTISKSYKAVQNNTKAPDADASSACYQSMSV